MSFDWKYHKWTVINNIEGTGEVVIFQAACILKVKFVEGFFNATFAPYTLQKHVEVHVVNFELDKISAAMIQNTTKLNQYDYLYKQVDTILESGSFESHLGHHF